MYILAATNRIIYLLSSYVLVQVVQAGEECQDRPHFNYNCWQLSMYCDRPQASGIRTSCPVTCGTCGRSSGTKLVANIDETPRESTLGQIERQIPIPPAPTVVVTQPQNTFQGLPPSSSPQNPRTLDDRGGFRGSVEPVRSEPVPRARLREVSDSEAEQRIRACCGSNGLRKDCLSMCTYSITKSEVLSKAIAGSCTLEDARTWVQCAADGRQNSQCCRNHGIFGCDGICNGQTDGDFGQLLTCVDNYLDTILKCHRDGLT